MLARQHFVLSPNHVENPVTQFHKHTQKVKKGYDSTYMTQFLTEEAEGRTEAELSVESRTLERSSKERGGQIVSTSASWLGSVLVTTLNHLGLDFMGATYFLPLANPSLMRESKSWSPRSCQVLSGLGNFHAHWLRYKAKTQM